MLNSNPWYPSSEPPEPCIGSLGIEMIEATIDPLIQRALAQVQDIGSIGFNEKQQVRDNLLVRGSIPGIIRERIAFALSGNLATVNDFDNYIAAVFNRKESAVTFLCDTSEAARDLACTLHGDWDGLNAVTTSQCNRAALLTAADLAEAEYCFVGQVCTLFTTYLSEHQSNACCQIPGAVLFRAILLAQQIPLTKDSPYLHNAEAHPVMIGLADWWNQNAPEPQHRCSAHAMVWVRVADNEYRSGHSGYSRAVTQGVANPAAVARWSNYLLLEFAKSRRTIYPDPKFLNWQICENVTSDRHLEFLAHSSQECDPDWYGLEALRHFPSRFPAAWEALCWAIEQEICAEPSR